MIIFITILFLYPSIFTTIAVFSVDTDLVPVILLVFLIYSQCVSDEDIGRIEHKIDYIFKGLINNPEMKKNYEKLHRSAWDHDYPMSLEDSVVDDGRLRQRASVIVDIINKITFFLLSAYWIVITLTT